MDAVSQEVAQGEINKWLDAKGIGANKREKMKDSIDLLVSYIMDGDLSLDDDCNIIQTLKFPVGESKLATLTYKPRLDIGKVNKRLALIKGIGFDARVVAYICALTDQNSAVIEMMDSEDYSVASPIVVFFM